MMIEDSSTLKRTEYDARIIRAKSQPSRSTSQTEFIYTQKQAAACAAAAQLNSLHLSAL